MIVVATSPSLGRAARPALAQAPGPARARSRRRVRLPLPRAVARGGLPGARHRDPARRRRSATSSSPRPTATCASSLRGDVRRGARRGARAARGGLERPRRASSPRRSTRSPATQPARAARRDRRRRARCREERRGGRARRRRATPAATVDSVSVFAARPTSPSWAERARRPLHATCGADDADAAARSGGGSAGRCVARRRRRAERLEARCPDALQRRVRGRRRRRLLPRRPTPSARPRPTQRFEDGADRGPARATRRRSWASRQPRPTRRRSPSTRTPACRRVDNVDTAGRPRSRWCSRCAAPTGRFGFKDTADAPLPEPTRGRPRGADRRVRRLALGSSGAVTPAGRLARRRGARRPGRSCARCASSGLVRENYRGAPRRRSRPASRSRWRRCVALDPARARSQELGRRRRLPARRLPGGHLRGRRGAARAARRPRGQRDFAGRPAWRPPRGWRGHARRALAAASPPAPSRRSARSASRCSRCPGSGCDDRRVPARASACSCSPPTSSTCSTCARAARSRRSCCSAPRSLGALDVDPLWAVGLFVGPILVLLPLDLRERGMLGDTGSNAIGAVAGCGSCSRCRHTGQAIALAVMAVVTVYGEFRSISALIERTPGLRHLDSLGRTTHA